MLCAIFGHKHNLSNSKVVDHWANSEMAQVMCCAPPREFKAEGYCWRCGCLFQKTYELTDTSAWFVGKLLEKEESK